MSTYTSNAKSGFPGVQWNDVNRKWRANIRKDRKLYYLGEFERLEDAVTARKAKEAEFREIGDKT